LILKPIFRIESVTLKAEKLYLILFIYFEQSYVASFFCQRLLSRESKPGERHWLEGDKAVDGVGLPGFAVFTGFGAAAGSYAAG
jgi:hypothetical protein